MQCVLGVLLSSCLICSADWDWLPSRSNWFPAVTNTVNQSQRRNAGPDWLCSICSSIHCNTSGSSNSVQTVKLGSADHMWIKVLFLHCLFLPHIISETHFSALFSCSLRLFVSRQPCFSCFKTDQARPRPACAAHRCSATVCRSSFQNNFHLQI